MGMTVLQLQGMFVVAPESYVVVDVDSPRFTVLAASDAYLRMTRRARAQLVGRGLFEAALRGADESMDVPVELLRVSFDRVIRSRAADALPLQRYRGTSSSGGRAAPVTHRRLVSSPVLDENGDVTSIIHHVEELPELPAQSGTFAVPRERERYRDVFESAPDGIFLVDAEGRLTNVNAAGCRLLDSSLDELRGRRMSDLIEPSERGRPSKLTGAPCDGGTEVSEGRLRRKDGSLLPVEISASCVPDGRVFGFVRDTSERKRAEDALRLSESILRRAVAMTADGLVCLDDSQRIVIFNECAEARFGYAKTEVLGRRCELLIPEAERETHDGLLSRIVESGEAARRLGSRTTAMFGRRKSGEVFPMDAAISRLEVDGRSVVTLMLRDIAAVRRAEDEQRLLSEVGRVLLTAAAECERVINDVAEAVAHGMAKWCAVEVSKSDGQRCVRIHHADPSKRELCETLERRSAKAQRSVVSSVAESPRPLLVDHVTSSYLASLATDEEHRNALLGMGTQSMLVVPLVARGRAVGTLSLGATREMRRYDARDVEVAEQIAARVVLAVENARLHELLAKALRARDEVLGMVAHDLRNPLNAILLNVRLMRRPRGRKERHDPSGLDAIQRCAAYMNSLVHDLLDIARLEAGAALTVRASEVPTSSAIEESLAHLRPALERSGRKLSIDEGAAPATIWADRTRLVQVLDNLLGNAIKFSHRCVTLAVSLRDGEACFRVGDDGGGLSRDDLAHVFDRFWQASATDNRGAGLGLSIVKGIVDAHGGRVWADSSVGTGTTFCFTLPASPPGNAPRDPRIGVALPANRRGSRRSPCRNRRRPFPGHDRSPCTAAPMTTRSPAPSRWRGGPRRTTETRHAAKLRVDGLPKDY
jgi:PAS domain S-box-containing protein